MDGRRRFLLYYSYYCIEYFYNTIDIRVHAAATIPIPITERSTDKQSEQKCIDRCTLYNDFIVGMHIAFEHKYKATGLL